MNFRLLQWVSPFAVATAAIALVMPALAADDLPEGKPVKYSDPAEKNDESATAPAQDQKDLLNRLQPQQNSSKGSLDGLPAPSVIPPSRNFAPNPKLQEMLDRRKDWIFSTPEQLILGNDKNSSFEPDKAKKDDASKPKLNPMEEYYFNLFRQAPKNSNPNATPDRDLNAKDDSRMPAGLRDREDQLKRLMLSEASSGGSSLSGVRADGGDFLGTRPVLETEQSLAQKARLDEYRQIFGVPAPQASMRELLMQTPKASALTTVNSGLGQSTLNRADALKASDPSGIFTSQNQVGMVPSAPQLADVNARALNPSILNPGNMRLDTKPVQPSLTPPTPTFSAPRRVF